MNKKTNTTDSGITRRDFLKLGGATVAGAAAFGTAQGADVKVKSAGTSPGIGGNQVYSVCPYCAVGCGMKIYVDNNKIVHIEGDEESPINRGSLCSKGNAAI